MVNKLPEERMGSTLWSPPSTSSSHTSHTASSWDTGEKTTDCTNSSPLNPSPSKTENPEKDHNFNHSETLQATENVSERERFLTLTQEQLIAELIKANARIQELESVPKAVAHCPYQISVDEHFSAQASSDDEDGLYLSSMNNIRKRTVEFSTGNPSDDSSPPRKYRNPDDFIVAYQHKGNFLPCDEDLSISSDLEEDPPDPVCTIPSRVTFESGIWEDDLVATMESIGEDLETDDDESEDFPLIPDPIIDTPPYEYIFLTRENEAKFRIFLNPKLNKVFQEELQKLQKQGEHVWTTDDPNQGQEHENNNNGDTPETSKGDWHNRNHLVYCSSSTINEVRATLSASNVIHCFDPSDVDLELKKIFTDKPPITHRIVRKKSRKERGSSVPAVDSYYGTNDLTKVGHASYFIPALTESERKAIGWKQDYQFGHWKYTTMNVPTVHLNPIPLHPHMDEKRSTHSKHSSHHHSHHHHHHHHHHPQDALLSQNPIHQKEISFSETSLAEGEGTKSKKDISSKKSCCKHPIHQQPSNDSLNFITLSGEFNTPASQSCHLIRNKGALKKLLKWLFPSCVKGKVNSTNDASLCDFSSRMATKDSNSRVESQTLHEIETLVEASDQFTFPVSQTNINFAMLKPGQEMEPMNGNKNGKSVHQIPVESYVPKSGHNSNQTKKLAEIVQQCLHDSNLNNNNNNNRHQEQSHHRSRDQQDEHKHHSPLHGLFQWTNKLSHGSSKKNNNESMSVVGGDVLESEPESVKPLSDYDIHEELTSEKLTLAGGHDKPLPLERLENDSFTEESQEEDGAPSGGEKRVRRRQSKLLKQGKAFNRLLTLKDLGYQTDDNSVSDVEEFPLPVETSQKELRQRKRSKSRGTERLSKVISSSDTNTDWSTRSNDGSNDIGKIFSKLHEKGQNQHGSKYLGKRKKYQSRSRSRHSHKSLKEIEGVHRDVHSSAEDGDDDISSCDSAHPLSPIGSSQQNSVATTHLTNYDDGLPNPGYYAPGHGQRYSVSGSCVVESRFLDPKDLLLAKYQDKLPFTYDYTAESIPDSNSVDQEDGILEWADKDFDNIEDGLGLLNSCLEVILTNAELLEDDDDDDETDAEQSEKHGSTGENYPADKVDGQHKLVTLNDLELESGADVENMNQSTVPPEGLKAPGSLQL